MTDIHIHRPFELGLSIVETESRLPSMRMAFTARGADIICQGKIWIECRAWDAFIAQLSSCEAVLHDMSRRFSIEAKRGRPNTLCLAYRKSLPSGSHAHCRLNASVEDEILSKFVESFRMLPRWW